MTRKSTSSKSTTYSAVHVSIKTPIAYAGYGGSLANAPQCGHVQEQNYERCCKDRPR